MMGQLDGNFEERSSVWIIMIMGMLVLVDVPVMIVPIDSIGAVGKTCSCNFGVRSIISFCKTTLALLIACCV